MQGLGIRFSVLQTQTWQKERRNDRQSSSDNRRNVSDKPSLTFNIKKKKRQDLTLLLPGIKGIKNHIVSDLLLFLLIIIIKIQA